MPRLHETIDTHLPLDDAFAFVSDFANAPKRIKSILRVNVLTPGPVGVGTRFTETRVMFGREATETRTCEATTF